jgi:hypothetical protein
MQAQVLSVASGNYYFKFGSMSGPQLLSFQPRYYENLPFCCVFRSTVLSSATINKIDLSIPMHGLLVQRDALDIRAAVYFNSVNIYNTTTGITADTGYAYRKVMLGYSGGHGIYNNNQNTCSWGNSFGSIGAGYNGIVFCGSFPDNLLHGIGVINDPVYNNTTGTWSHWVYWKGVSL